MLTCNTLPVASMRVVIPWTGVWMADLEMTGDVLPSGKVAIASSDGIALVGTVVPSRTSDFAEKRHARVLAGGGGWGKPVRPQHYHSAANVLLTTVVSTTAAEAGEAAVVLEPRTLGTDFARMGNLPASNIFAAAGVDWWVGFDGVTRVAPKRLPAVPHPSLEILDWDQGTSVARFRCDVLVEPGTPIVDARFGASARVVRAVEATVAEGSVTGSLWLELEAPAAGASTALADALSLLATHATRAEFSRLYEFRVIAMAGEAVELQAVDRKVGVPDVLPGPVWAGVSGYKAKLRPSSKVLVGFISGDPKRPYVAAYEPPDEGGWRPVELELDAVALVEIGAQALAVALGGVDGAVPVAKAPAVVAFANSVAAAFESMALAISPLPGPLVGAPIAGAMAPAVAAVKAAAGALATACPSPKVVTS